MPTLLTEIAAEHQLGEVCGIAKIAAKLQRKRLGIPYATELPIGIALYMSTVAYGVAEQMIYTALCSSQEVNVSIELAHKDFPDLASLGDLDVSIDAHYPVVGFDIWTRHRNKVSQ